MTKTVDEIIITRDNQIVIVEKTESDQSVGYSRRVINIGASVEAETPRVKQIAQLVHSEDFLQTPITLPNNANWDNFNKAMLSNQRFNEILNTVGIVSIATVASLPAALTQVSLGQLSMFKELWDMIMLLGNATIEDKESWIILAESNNLPDEFISILRGN